MNNVVDDTTAQRAGYASLQDWRDKTGRTAAEASQKAGGGNFGSAVDFAKQIETQRQALLAQQAQQEQSFLTKYTGAIQGQESLPAMQSRLNTQYGVPTYQAAATDVQNTLSQIPTTAASRTQQFGMSAPQENMFKAEQYGKLTPALDVATRNLTTAQGNVSQGLQLGTAEEQKQLQPLTMEGTLLSDRIARETTGFTQDKQSELDVLLRQIASDQAVSQAALDRANTLASNEKLYTTQLKIQQMKNEQLKSLGKYGGHIDANGDFIPAWGQQGQGPVNNSYTIQNTTQNRTPQSRTSLDQIFM